MELHLSQPLWFNWPYVVLAAHLATVVLSTAIWSLRGAKISLIVGLCVWAAGWVITNAILATTQSRFDLAMAFAAVLLWSVFWVGLAALGVTVGYLARTLFLSLRHLR